MYENAQIVLFDGDCNLCSRSVSFLKRLDKKVQFKFVSLNSEIGKGLLKKYDCGFSNTIVLIKSNKKYTQSTAILEIVKLLNYPWKFFYLLKLIPGPLRDIIYQFIARNRHKILGKPKQCALPDLNEF